MDNQNSQSPPNPQGQQPNPQGQRPNTQGQHPNNSGWNPNNQNPQNHNPGMPNGNNGFVPQGQNQWHPQNQQKPSIGWKKITLIITIIVVTVIGSCVGLVAAVRNSSNQKRQTAAERDEMLLEGKVEIPDTLFKTREEVEALFKAAGLVPKFVVSNFDDVAALMEHFLRAGECNEVDISQPGIKYFEGNDVYGFYADKGATIIVGYSDHDFDGTVKEEEAPEPEDADDSVNESTDENTAKNAGIPADVVKQLDEINGKYDKLIKQAQGFSDRPETYTMSAYTEFMLDYSEIIADYDKLSDTLDKYEDFSSGWDGYDIWMSIYKKNLQLLDALTKLPDDFAN